MKTQPWPLPLLLLSCAALIWPVHAAKAQLASPFPWLQSINPDMSGLPQQTTSSGPQFGHSVAIWNDFMVVGAPTTQSEGSGGANRERGRLYLYRRVDDQWVPHQIIEGMFHTHLDGHCGRSVAMAGGFLVHGCPGAHYLHVSRFDGENFGTTLSSTIDSGNFGHSVSVTGSQESTAFLAVGAPSRSSDVGLVTTRRWNSATQSWQASVLFTPQNPVGAERFGESVSISLAGLGGLTNVRMAVGAPGANQWRGAVYVFEYAGGSEWNQIARITAPNAQPGDRFGASVAHRTARGPGATGSLLVVGAPGRHTDGNTALDHRRGTVSVYRSAGTTYHSEGEVALVCVLPPCTDAQQLAFGASVAVQGDYIYVGAPLFRQGSQGIVGRVYRAELLSGVWISTATYSPGPLSDDCGTLGSARPEGLFGSAVAVTPYMLAVGYPNRGCQQNTMPPSPPGPRRGQVRIFGIIDNLFSDRFEQAQ